MLANGFFEWQRTGAVRIPMHVVMRSGETFALAGLWSVWRDPDGNRIPSCPIITITASDLLRLNHDRMQVNLPRDREDFWLDWSVADPGVLGSVLTPYPDDAMEAYEVSTLVNSVANDGPEVIEAVA